MLKTEDTIAAIATARGEAGVAIIRVSGKQAWPLVLRIFSNPDLALAHGRFYHGWILDPSQHGGAQAVDEVLLLAFQAPHSYTGEDSIEIQCHGGDYITHRILQLCLEQGARMANPGEFTLRAFLSGKMDLTQAESVMDLVSAKSDRLLTQASTNLRNRSLGQYIELIAKRLIEVQSQIVASVDFPDEVDEPDRLNLAAILQQLLTKMQRLRESARRNRMVRDGIKVAIVGMPNSGKSSLFNALLATERSIVTEQAGTTRDVVTESLQIAGIPVTLVDTAGIRETQHSIEMMGIERSWQAASEAQFVLYVIDSAVGLLRYDAQILGKLDPQTTLIVGNKLDLLQNPEPRPGWAYMSAKTGEGLDMIYQRLEMLIRSMSTDESGVTLSLNQRQLQCCEAVCIALEDAMNALNNPLLPLDISTVPLTEALRKLDELLGKDTTEEVLTSVFSQFCVGK